MEERLKSGGFMDSLYHVRLSGKGQLDGYQRAVQRFAKVFFSSRDTYHGYQIPH